MHIYTARFSTLPGYLTILSSSEKEAHDIANTWHTARFTTSVESIVISKHNTDWELGPQLLRDAMRISDSGVVHWRQDRGWIVLAPGVDDVGVHYRSLAPVHCFEFSGSREDGRTLIFAATRDDADTICKAWAEAQGRQHERNFRVAWPITFPTHHRPAARVRHEQALGITGLASITPSGWSILPPWHPHAGSFAYGMR